MAFKLIVQNSKILLKSVANYIINATGIKDLFTGDSSIDSNGKINWTLQHYADTAANFTSNNPTLLVGQIGIETDNLLTTPKFKIGDGANDWNTLPYANSTSGGTWGTITGTLSNQTDLQTALNAKEDTANKSTNVNTDQASNTKYPSVKAVYDWATGLFVKKGTLTANTIPKATASDAIGNSQITDDGTNVGIVGNIQIGGVADARLYIKNANGNYYFAVENGGGLSIFYINPNGRVSIGTLQDIYKLKVDGSFASATIVDDGANVGINTLPSEKLHVNGNIRCDNLTASQIVETDASKNLVSAAKGTAYNKNFGTSSGTVTEGGTTVLKTGDSLSGALNEAKGTDIASASTTNIGAANGNYIHITGTTTITAFDTVQAGTSRTLVFDGALTLTHNATSLILPGAANITTAAGDTAIFRSEGNGNWKCISYTNASDSYINFAPSFTGFSVAPTVNTGDCRYKMLSRNTCHFIFYPSALGTSNATTFTITLPFASANIGPAGQTYIVQVYNNGASATGTMRTRLNSNICDVYTSNFGTFTASNGKSLMCSIVYQTEL